MKKLYINDAAKFALNAFVSNINVFAVYGAIGALLLVLGYSTTLLFLPKDFVSAFILGDGARIVELIPTIKFSYHYILLAFIWAVYFIVRAALYLGLAKVALCIEGGGKANKKDLLFGFKCIAQYFVASIFYLVQFFIVSFIVILFSKLVLSGLLSGAFATYVPMVLYFVASVVLFVVSIIPFFFLSFIVVEKKLGYVQAIRKSFNIVKNARFSLSFMMLILLLIGSVVSFLIKLVFPATIPVQSVFNLFIISPITLFIITFVYKRLEEQS